MSALSRLSAFVGSSVSAVQNFLGATSAALARAAISAASSGANSDITSLTALASPYVPASSVGANSGVASLDSGGRVPITQLPSAIVGSKAFLGLWNASTNNPTITSGSGTAGNFYTVSVAGTTTVNGVSTWSIGDEIIFENGAWAKLPQAAGDVISVAGLFGVISAAALKAALAIAAGDVSGLGSAAALTAGVAANNAVQLTAAAKLPAVDASLVTNLTPAQIVTALGSTLLMGRNRLLNAAFAVNQAGVSGTVTLTAGQYGHDGVKAGASGCTYTFAASGLDTTLTISAGSLIMPVEAASIEGGSYVLSHAGTAQARIWQGTGSTGSGSYAAATTAAPLAATGLTAATQTNAEFSTGTVLRPQLEPGAQATAFERRSLATELQQCVRFFWQGQVNIEGYGNGTSILKTAIPNGSMRAAPTGAVVSTLASGGCGSPAFETFATGSFFRVTSTATGDCYYNAIVSLSARL